MKRKNLEHLIRAAAAITNRYEFMVVGSQSILGAIPDAPEELLVSTEADLYPFGCPDSESEILADLIDGSIGEGSPFENLYGYYAQGVGPKTAILPKGWENRVVRVQNENTEDKIGYCLDPRDLAASKLCAGREKDLEFVLIMLEHEIITPGDLYVQVDLLPVGDDQKSRLESWISRAEKTILETASGSSEPDAPEDEDGPRFEPG